MLKTIVIDDEAKARESLVFLLEKYCPEVAICAMADTFEEAYKLVNQHQPQLVFADVQLHSVEGTGIELITLLNLRNTAIIFTSGWKDYAVEAFRLNAVDYLLKPINIQQLIDAVDKAKKFISDQARNNPAPAPESNTLHIPTVHGFIIIRQNEIIRCEAEGPYTHFFVTTPAKKITASVNLGQIEKRLSRELFFRTHKSYIINREHIIEYQRGDGGIAKMSDKFETPVSRGMKDEFLRWLEKTNNLSFSI